jgi:hypothetical protein
MASSPARKRAIEYLVIASTNGDTMHFSGFAVVGRGVLFLNFQLRGRSGAVFSFLSCWSAASPSPRASQAGQIVFLSRTNRSGQPVRTTVTLTCGKDFERDVRTVFKGHLICIFE